MSEPTPVPEDAFAALVYNVLLAHKHVVGPYFNLVCTCGHRGTTVSTKYELEAHQAVMIQEAIFIPAEEAP